MIFDKSWEVLTVRKINLFELFIYGVGLVSFIVAMVSLSGVTNSLGSILFPDMEEAGQFVSSVYYMREIFSSSITLAISGFIFGFVVRFGLKERKLKIEE